MISRKSIVDRLVLDHNSLIASTRVRPSTVLSSNNYPPRAASLSLNLNDFYPPPSCRSDLLSNDHRLYSRWDALILGTPWQVLHINLSVQQALQDHFGTRFTHDLIGFFATLTAAAL